MYIPVPSVNKVFIIIIIIIIIIIVYVLEKNCWLSSLFHRVDHVGDFVFQCDLHPVNTKHLYNIYTMLDRRRRRWADVVQMLYKCFVFAG